MAIPCRSSAGHLPAADRRWGNTPTSTTGGTASRPRPPVDSRRYPLFPPALPSPQHQEGIRQHHQRDVMLPAPPRPTLEVVQTQFVLQLLVTVLYPPPPLR